MTTLYRILALGVLSLMVCILSFQAHAESITLWGTTHDFVGVSSTVCSQAHISVEDEIKKKSASSKIPNLIYADAETPSAWKTSTEKNIIGIAEDSSMRGYIDLYGMTEKLVTQVYGSFLMKQKVDPQEYVDILKQYLEVLTTHVDKEIFKKILMDRMRHPYLDVIQGDIDAQNKPLSADPGPGFLRFVLEYYKTGNASVDDLKPILSAYLKLSKDVGVIVFNQKIKPQEAKYNITIKSSDSPYYNKKIFDYIEPNKLFTENFFIAYPKTKTHQAIYNLFISQWRNYFIFQNLVSLIQKQPTANILVWVGEKHIPYLVRMVVKSKTLTAKQKEKMRVITMKTNPTIACEANLVLEAVKTGQGIDNLMTWDQKNLKNFPSVE